MTKPNSSLALRFMPSLTDVAFLLPIPFVFVTLGGAKLFLGDGDTGWHVRTGQWILANHRLPYADLFSFTQAGKPWFAWEWLWDVAFGWLHQQWGMAAVLLACLLVVCLTCALTYRLTCRKCDNIFIAFGVSLLAIYGSTIHWLARPHLFTLLFVCIFYYILEKVRESGDRPEEASTQVPRLQAGAPAPRSTLLLWCLPVLMVVWTNLHGGWVAGLLLILPYAAGEFTSYIVEPRDKPESRLHLLMGTRYLLCAAGCLLATLINPYFYRLHLHLITYFTEPYHFDNIDEFLPLNFRHPAARYFECMLLITALAVFREVARRRYVYAFLLLGWAHLALYAGRNIPIFLILAAPPAAAAVHDLLKKASTAGLADWVRNPVNSLEEFAAGLGSMDRVGRFHIASALVLAVVAALFFAPTPPEGFRAEYDSKRFPTKALAAFQNAEFLNRVFTVDYWGGYLIYRLYPAGRVFVDGRSDFYGQKFEEEYRTLLQPKYNWEKTLRRYRVETVLLPVSVPLVCVMKESKNWQVAYDDGIAIIFRHSTRYAKKHSANGNIGGVTRDCQIAKTSNRDPRITQT